MPSDALFSPISTNRAAEVLLSDEAYLQAMLDVEVALAQAQAEHGVIPDGVNTALRPIARAENFDIAELGREAIASGTPVIALVAGLAARMPPQLAGYVHLGATSQDILDTATMLVTRKVLDVVDADLGRVAGTCAALAAEHRATAMLGRTLLQPAAPTTFGLKAAGWLTATLAARDALRRVKDRRLAVQVGGAAGTMAGYGPGALVVAARMAELLDLAEPVGPWHTDRARIAEIGSALATTAGVMGKIALDIVLLAQAEVAEVAEGAGGGSSSMPQKRNPAGAVAIRANALRLPGLASALFSAMAQEHERGAGTWQAEWPVIREALSLTAGSAFRTAAVLDGLSIDATRMGVNLFADGGLAFSEPLALALAPSLGRTAAQAAVQRAVVRVRAEVIPLREAAALDGEVTGCLAGAELDRVFGPGAATGSSGALIDRALAAFAANP